MSKKTAAEQATDSFEKSALEPQKNAHAAPPAEPQSPELGTEKAPETDHDFDPTAAGKQAEKPREKSSDELAKRMFDAYTKRAGGKTYDEKPIPSWDGERGVGPVVRNRWRAAALEAEEALLDGAPSATFEEEPPQ